MRPTTALLLSVALASHARGASLRLPAIISDHMVLQADQPDPIWGWAVPGAAIKVDLTDSQGSKLAHAEAKADEKGKWVAKLPLLKAGAACQLNVSAGGESAIVKDVLVGETWLCGGQSNMGYFIGEKNATPDILDQAHKEATAAGGAIRYFQVIKLGYAIPQDDVHGDWRVATAETVDACSAVGWNFAVDIHDKLKRPVGLIVSAMGGTNAEAWLPKTVLDSLSCGSAIAKREAEREVKNAGGIEDFDRKVAAWLAANPTPELQEENIKTVAKEPGVQFSHIPSRYYNGMIHGLEPYGLKGVLWYQGGDNLKNYTEYPELVKAVVQTWRKDWGDEFPFYYVELQNEDDPQTIPVDDKRNVALLREAQNAALELPKVDVVSAIDLAGAEGALTHHYANKKPLGQRLANMALEETYGENLGEVHGPAFTGSKVEGDKMRITFSHAEGLKTMNDGPAKGFAVRGGSGGWVWGDAKIDGKDILVSGAQIPNPAAVRYGWAQNPVLSIQNGAGLPLRPFRTDKDK